LTVVPSSPPLPSWRILRTLICIVYNQYPCTHLCGRLLSILCNSLLSSLLTPLSSLLCLLSSILSHLLSSRLLSLVIISDPATAIRDSRSCAFFTISHGFSPH
jgi:hypothetical protein